LTALVAFALATAAAVVVEFVAPGESVYHAGWYNVLIAALAVATFIAGRRRLRSVAVIRKRLAILAVVSGAAIAALAGIVSGLLAPDNQSFIGAPGQRIAVESLGALVFPLASSDTAAEDSVTLERSWHAPASIGERRRYAGAFALRTIPRAVVYVEARDLRGNRLTVTQPTGSVFLSPVLLMEHRQTLAGIDLPFDSFNVPASGRVVKAVMFTAAQAAMLVRGGAQPGAPAVLFAVDDENERPVPHAIALSSGGRPVRVGGLILRGEVVTYPAVEVVAVPNPPVAILGALLMLCGIIGLIWV
jgi:hypothetical protein